MPALYNFLVPAGNIEIRPAVPADAAATAACLAAAFESHRTAYTRAAFADTVPDTDGVALRIQEMHVLLAVSGARVVGTISAAASGDHGHLRGMAVLPEFQGTGVAARLLAGIEDWLRAQGCRAITLDTTEPLITAMKFYEKHGYLRSGKTADFFGMPLIEYVKTI